MKAEKALRWMVLDRLEGAFVHSYRWPTCLLLIVAAPLWFPALLIVMATFALASRINAALLVALLLLSGACVGCDTVGVHRTYVLNFYGEAPVSINVSAPVSHDTDVKADASLNAGKK